MRNWSARVNNKFWLLQVIWFSLFVGAPLIYLFIVQTYEQALIKTTQLELIAISALLVAVGSPLLIPILRKAIIEARIKLKEKGQNPEDGVFTAFIIFGSLIEASYILGLVLFFLSHEMLRMLYFYPIGIIWTIKYWPTAERFEQLLNELKVP